MAVNKFIRFVTRAIMITSYPLYWIDCLVVGKEKAKYDRDLAWRDAGDDYDL